MLTIKIRKFSNALYKYDTCFIIRYYHLLSLFSYKSDNQNYSVHLIKQTSFNTIGNITNMPLMLRGLLLYLLLMFFINGGESESAIPKIAIAQKNGDDSYCASLDETVSFII